MRKLKLILVVALLIAILPAQAVLALTSDTVVITATPSYINISNDPDTWILNGIAGGGTIDVNTIYYSNPGGDTTPPSAVVVDGECRFTLTNTSGPDIDIGVNCSDFESGDATMTNSDLGSNGATDFGGYAWYSGMAYNAKVIMKTTASDNLTTIDSTNATMKWGAQIETRTNAWTGSGASTANMTILATPD